MLIIRPFAMSTDYEKVMLMKLRSSDLVEIKASLDVCSEDAIGLSVTRSTLTYVVCEDDRIIAIFGVRHATPEELGLTSVACKDWKCGIPWYLGSLPTSKKGFMKLSREITKGMFNRYDFLCNYVALSNVKSIKWLSRLGYEIGREKFVFFDENEPFVVFYRSAHD